ncbi:tripartite motif-containing protein 45-like [Strongylocentrotus purpuratus]|uniref:B box-type domain-containing protein n=1 Tax=Strongylocentrotus purpuratus TaxID=7668 RepID=A0A7M7NGQ6_STRPU|nr:tripartite motif-containing protein 45-like [Strongylocentrotus purpuratus]
MFEAHEIVSVQDIINGKVSIGHLSEKCYIHKQEDKDMFCEDCKVHVCLKCVIVGHQFHKIKNQADFEQQLRLKVNDLVQRCAAKKTELEKNIQNVKVQRHEVYSAVQKLLDDVSEAYSIKAKELEENHQNLIEQLNSVKQSFEDDLNVLKSKDRQRIKSICSSITLVANDRLGRLETDSLSAHILLCDELDAMLKEATDHTSAAAITKKAQEKRFKPADKSRLDLGSILESDPKVQVIQCVDLRGEMRGMTQYSDGRVAIGYLNDDGIDIIDSIGKQEQYANIPSNVECFDIVFLQDRSLCISTFQSSEAHIYSPNGSRKSTIHVKGNGYSSRLTGVPQMKSSSVTERRKSTSMTRLDPLSNTLFQQNTTIRARYLLPGRV